MYKINPVMRTINLFLLLSFFALSCSRSGSGGSPGGNPVPLLGAPSGDRAANAYGGTGDDAIVTTIPLPDGGALSAGYTSSNDGQVSGNHGSYDYWVVRTDSAGRIVWQKTYGGSASDRAAQLIATPDGNYVIIGTSLSTDGDKQGGGPVWMFKIDGKGNMVWQKSYGVPGQVDTVTAIDNTPGGGLALLYNGDNGQGLEDVILTVTDGTGNYVCGLTQGSSSFSYRGYSVKAVQGGYVIAGQTFDTAGQLSAGHGGGDLLLEKISPDGHLLWKHVYGGTGPDAGYWLLQTPDRGFLAVGSSGSHDGDIKKNAGDLDWLFCKVDSAGILQWTNTYGGSGREEADFISPALDGNYLVTGYTRSHDGSLSGNHGGSDILVVKIDPGGQVLSQRLCGGSADEHPGQGLEPSPGHYWVVGTTASQGGDVIGAHGGWDGWIFRF